MELNGNGAGISADKVISIIVIDDVFDALSGARDSFYYWIGYWWNYLDRELYYDLCVYLRNIYDIIQKYEKFFDRREFSKHFFKCQKDRGDMMNLLKAWEENLLELNDELSKILKMFKKDKINFEMYQDKEGKRNINKVEANLLGSFEKYKKAIEFFVKSLRNILMDFLTKI